MVIKVLKFLVRCLLRLLYRVEVAGMEHYHRAGERVLIIANHISLLDGVLLYAWLPETPRFAVNTQIAERRLYRLFLWFAEVYTMEPTSPLSVKSMVRFLQEDNKVVIFPEGRVTVTGALMKVYEGPGLIADRAAAAILPIAIDGAQHSGFAYLEGNGGKFLRFPRISLRILPPEKIVVDPSLQGGRRRRAAAAALQDVMHRLSFACYDYDKTIFTAVLEAAALFGRGQVALEDVKREPLTYGQLLTRAFILGRVFREDTAPGETVGLLLPNVAATVVSYLALQSLGRVPAMLNYTTGAQVLLQSCETASVKTVYTSRRFLEEAELEPLAQALGGRVNLVCLEDLGPRIGAADKLLGLLRSYRPRLHYRRLCPRRDPGAPATVLFTSGSEGAPKGVVLSHRNLLANFAQVRGYLDFTSRDVFFSCLPLFHSFGLNIGSLLPLLGGCRTFLYPSPLHYRVIPELLYGTGATILFGANTFLRGYARYAHPYDFHFLRYVLAGAEKLQDDTQRTWMEKFGIRILQGYGVTECSPVVAVNTPINHKMGSVGKLLPGMEAYLAPVPGIARGGRLVVRGANVMLGYLLPGAAGKIQPPATERGAGWYDTGDIATIDEDGYIELLGRAKRFAKIGGEMVSLAAVEELAAGAWPQGAHAAVALPDERKGEKIILVTDCPEAERKDVQDQARACGYGELYIPREVVRLESLPVLGTGKVDYITLAKLMEERAPGAAAETRAEAEAGTEAEAE